MVMKLLQSFIDVPENSHFPIQNLPYGVFKRRAEREEAVPTIGVAIGEEVLDLSVLESSGLLSLKSLAGKKVFSEPTLNSFMAAGRSAWREAREIITKLLSKDEPRLRDDSV